MIISRLLPAAIVPGASIFELGENSPAIAEMQLLLGRYGYGVEASGNFDATTRDVVTAFQRHFRPAQVDGIADPSTIATIKAVLAARDAQGG